MVSIMSRRIMHSQYHNPHRQHGTSLLEVVVTIAVLSFGLFGLNGLTARLQVAEIETYQRAQALMLLKDMASRIATNRYAASSYVTSSPLGSGTTCASTDASSTRQQLDASQWCAALQGAAETASGSRVGALVSGRGCVEALGSNEYMVTVVWQGLTPVSAPPSSVGCGQGLYDGGTACTADLCRRALTTVVRIAPLT